MQAWRKKSSVYTFQQPLLCSLHFQQTRHSLVSSDKVNRSKLCLMLTGKIQNIQAKWQFYLYVVVGIRIYDKHSAECWQTQIFFNYLLLNVSWDMVLFCTPTISLKMELNGSVWRFNQIQRLRISNKRLEEDLRSKPFHSPCLSIKGSWKQPPIAKHSKWIINVVLESAWWFILQRIFYVHVSTFK